MEITKLLALSVPVLRDRYLDRGRPVPAGLLEALQRDPRQGARELARRIADRRRENRAEGQRLRHLLVHERALWEGGGALFQIAGVDEAGCAPLAGPVVAAACILPRDFHPRGIDDSKRLDAQQRAALEVEIRRAAVAWSIGLSSVEEIDAINIYRASLQAMSRAVAGLSMRPDFLLVDARKVPDTDIPQRGLIHGDALSLTIAAASILAKTARDRMLDEYARAFPGYGFEEHKGYPTPEHFAALDRLGPCAIHRRSFAPVRKALGLRAPEPEQTLAILEVVGARENGR